ncbi:MAG: cell division protein ZapE [Pseudomonadota bacterium]
MTLPLKAYRKLVASGTLWPDPAQEEVAITLDNLAQRLQGYAPNRRNGFFRKPQKAPEGLYLWGGVGVGKSLLMDLFVEGAPIRLKRRVHFHAFLQEIHGFIANWRQLDEKRRKIHPARLKSASLDDPIPHAANAVFQKAHLFCFDEFQVTDITDAMLLGRLFEQLFAQGAVIVATSNRPPDERYKEGLNRELFIPFIDLLKSKTKVFELEGAKDYRLDRLHKENVYFHPLGDTAHRSMNTLWGVMTANALSKPTTLLRGSRKISIPHAARGAVRAPFSHWCGHAFGPGDYLQIAQQYRTVFIDDIPLMGGEDRNEAKRFVTFIDALYEAKCTLIASAAAAPEDLYPEGDGAFEFGRTVSRLYEMQSMDYFAQAHAPQTHDVAPLEENA